MGIAGAIGAMRLIVILACLMASPAFSQDILVLGPGNNKLVDDQTGHDPFNGTHCLTVAVGGQTSKTFTIRNLDRDTDLDLSAVQISNTTDFAILENVETVVGPNGSSQFSIQFSPASPGIKTCTVTIPNNDDDGTEDQFTFMIGGEGAASGIPATADLSITSIERPKFDKSGVAKLRVTIANAGPGVSTIAILSVFDESEAWLRPETLELTQAIIEPIQPGKTKRLTIKVDPARQEGYLFLRAGFGFPLQDGVDANLSNNQGFVRF